MFRVQYLHQIFESMITVYVVIISFEFEFGPRIKPIHKKAYLSLYLGLQFTGLFS